MLLCGGGGTVNLAFGGLSLGREARGHSSRGPGGIFRGVSGFPAGGAPRGQLAVGGNARPVDIALANNLRYAGVAGLGFDSEVARYANERVKWLRGSAVYLYAILRVLPRFRPLRVSIDGRPEEVMFAVFANSSQYGSGIRIAPDASITDGRLDACIVHRTSRLQLLKTLPQAYTGTHVRSRFVEMRRAEAFRVDSDPPLDVYADGERLTQTPVRFSIAKEQPTRGGALIRGRGESRNLSREQRPAPRAER